MAAEETLTPTSYINHHLSFFTKPVGEGGFWTLNVDTLATSLILGLVSLGFMAWIARGATAGVPNKRQAFVEVLVDLVDGQVAGVFHGERKSFVAPAALTVVLWVLLMNAMDFLPVDIMAQGTRGAGVPQVPDRADGGRQHHVRARALGLAADDLLLDQG